MCRVNLVFRVPLCLCLFLLWMQKLVTRTHSHWEDKDLTSIEMTHGNLFWRQSWHVAILCTNTSWWPLHLQQWWGVGSKWGSRCVWCTPGWRACSRRRIAAGPDTGRTDPTAGPHSGATGPEGDATLPPRPRERDIQGWTMNVELVKLNMNKNPKKSSYPWFYFVIINIPLKEKICMFIIHCMLVPQT